MQKKPTPQKADLDLAPHSITLERDGRHLKIQLDRISRKSTFHNFYSPFRIFKMRRHVFRLQHLLYMIAMDLTITYKAPGILKKAKELKDGESLHLL